MMLDQSFSAENFQRIWDLRTRRGENLSLYFPKVAAASDELRAASADLKSRLRNLASEDAESDIQAARYSELRDSARLHRNQLVSEHLAGVALEANRRIDSGELKIAIQKGQIIRGKATYRLDPTDAASYFISRQLESNIKHAFELRPPNRNLAAEQLLLALDDRTEKIVVRTDIKSFYESISHDRLRDILRRSPVLSRTTCRFVDMLLNDYALRNGSPRGLPRGIGVSAALAEAYLSQLDHEFLGMPDVLFYVRYVDDIVVIFSGSQHHPAMSARKALVREMISRTGLLMNPVKTKYLVVSKSMQNSVRFSYLGYEFTVDSSKVTVDLSMKRDKRYRKRIDVTVENYSKSKRDGSARQVLYDRIRLITGNTRLSNNKRHALIGIYYSNSLLDAASPKMERLDKYLARKLQQQQLPQMVGSRLSELGFQVGFNERTFSSFSPRKMEKLVTIWKQDD